MLEKYDPSHMDRKPGWLYSDVQSEQDGLQLADLKKHMRNRSKGEKIPK